ncbi:MRP family ATP-binding protein [Paenibacillus sp. CAA11]|uniref:Mrp/NBP35 family ATP-binding protein n=1 Tax=Paenibacillus sp. CAA11 TaxID=1532905 RepID=UPI000D3A746E|nr:Mrp/NBP35 family ATP-binding protein [Paenibacillus sp. CAA11]AWB46101.1 MRP family ATP-binding protein [Paenibacillus sp. CAA11]
MVTKEWIQAALRPIADPKLGRSLVEMQWIRDIMIKEERISLTLVSQDKDHAANEAIEREIRERLQQAGIQEVHIRIRNASESELAEAGYSQTHPTQDTDKAPLKGHGAGLESLPLLDPNSKVKFIAIASGKGGVGKSTVTVNLAAALARMGQRVGIIDADIYGFSVPDMMGIEEVPHVENGQMLPVERFDVKVMSMGFFVRENNPVVWRGPMLGRMIRQFLSEVNWGELDYMLLDLPPGTGDIALDVHQILPQSKEIIVTTPHATAAYVAARAGAMAIQTDHEIVGVVENMAFYECTSCGEREYVFGKGGGARLAETLSTDLLAQIPLGSPDNHPSEPDFSPSVYKDDTPIGRRYDDLAAVVIQKCKED